MVKISAPKQKVVVGASNYQPPQRFFSIEIDGIPVSIDSEVTIQYSNSGQVLQIPMLGNKRYLQNLGSGLLESSFTIILAHKELYGFYRLFEQLKPYLVDGKPCKFKHPFLGEKYGVFKTDITAELTFASYGIAKIPVVFYELTNPTIKLSDLVFIESTWVQEYAQDTLKEQTKKDVKLSPLLSTYKFTSSINARLNRYRAMYQQGIQNINLLANLLIATPRLFKNLVTLPQLSISLGARTKSQYVGRSNSVSPFPAVKKTDTNPVLPESHIDTLTGFMEYLYILPESIVNEDVANGYVYSEDERTESVDALRLLLINAIHLSFKKELENTYQVLKDTERVYQDSTHPSNIFLPASSANSFIAQQAIRQMEFIYVYNFIEYIKTYNDYEFTNSAEALDVLKVVKEGIQTLLGTKYVNKSIITRLIRGLTATRFNILNQIPELPSRIKIKTNGLPVRSIVYKLNGTLDNIDSTYFNNQRIFDLGDVENMEIEVDV